MQSNKNIKNQYPEQELIRKYLADTLTKEEEQTVAQLYQNNADFRDALDGFENMSVAEFDEWLTNTDQLIDSKLAIPVHEMIQPESEFIIENNKVKEIHPYRRMAIAASVLLFLMLGCYIVFTQMQSTSTKLYVTHFELKDYPDMITRGSGEELSTTEKLAISAYNAENYEVSIEHFEALKNKYPDNVKYGLFLGISYLGSNQPDFAVKALTSVEYEGTAYCNDVNWYLGLAYLKLNNKKDAKDVFTKLASEDCYYKEVASEILVKL